MDIKLACMSLMWGKADLANEKGEPWLADVVEAGYDGVARFGSCCGRFRPQAASSFD